MHLYQGLHSVYFRIRCTYAEPLRGHGSLHSKLGCEIRVLFLRANSSFLATVLCEGGVQLDVSDESSKSTIMIKVLYLIYLGGMGGGEGERQQSPIARLTTVGSRFPL